MFIVFFAYFDLNHTYFWYKFECWWHWNKSSKWKAYLACLYMTFKEDCREMFVVCWHQFWKLVQVVVIQVSLFYSKLRKLLSSVRLWKILKQIFQLESIPCVYLRDILKIVCKGLFWCFICEFVSFCCVSWSF